MQNCSVFKFLETGKDGLLPAELELRVPGAKFNQVPVRKTGGRLPPKTWKNRE